MLNLTYSDEIEEKLNEEVNTTENEESGAMIIKIKNTSNMKVIKVIYTYFSFYLLLETINKRRILPKYSRS